MNPVYCTLFDKNYLTKGRLLLKSLAEHVPAVDIFVLALDEETSARIVSDGIGGVRVMPLQVLLDDRLQAIQAGRTHQEFCWTLEAVWFAFCLDGLERPTVYLDAESYFFGDPALVFKGIGHASVALVPHRFAAIHRERETDNGFYNANFVYAKPDAAGQAFAREWRDLCLDWCYNRHEPKRWANQLYLDRLAVKYDAHTIQHLGLNLAPWNQLQYNYAVRAKGSVPTTPAERMLISDHLDETAGWPLIMYHFHEFVSAADPTHWELNPMVAEHVYPPYVAAYAALEEQDGPVLHHPA